MAHQGRGIIVENYDLDIHKATKIHDFTVSDPKGSEVLIKMLAAPIHPADVYCIKGTFGHNPVCPFYVGSFEGVGEILKAGPEVTSVKVGDWIIPSVTEFGAWRTLCVKPESQVLKIDNNIGLTTAATLYLNPFTAYLLLKDVIDLNKGDIVLQNGANSTVGQALIQIAEDRGIRTINVIRKRSDAEAEAALKKKLEDLGADLVITDEELKKLGADPAWPNGLKKPNLVIDCVAGEAGSDLARLLAYGGTFCSYGVLSGQPLTLNAGELIFQNKKCCGFLTSRCFSDPNRKKDEILPYLTGLIKQGKFQAPECRLFKMDDFQEALKLGLSSGAKPVLVMDNSYLK